MRFLSEVFDMSSPSIEMKPSVGSSILAKMLRNVDLPDPDGPIIAINSPSDTFNVKPSRTWIFSRLVILKDFFRSLTVRMEFRIFSSDYFDLLVLIVDISLAMVLVDHIPYFEPCLVAYDNVIKIY